MSGEIDLCLSSPRFAEVAVEWLPLWDEDLVALVPDSHRLAGREEIDLIELATDPFIALKPNYGLRQTADDLCREAGFSPHVAFEGEEVATLRGLVGAGFGVALVPKSGGGSDVHATLANDPYAALFPHVRSLVGARPVFAAGHRGVPRFSRRAVAASRAAPAREDCLKRSRAEHAPLKQEKNFHALNHTGHLAVPEAHHV